MPHKLSLSYKCLIYLPSPSRKTLIQKPLSLISVQTGLLGLNPGMCEMISERMNEMEY